MLKPFWSLESLVSLILRAVFRYCRCRSRRAVPAGLGGAGIVAVRAADLRSPLRRPPREGDRTALTAEGAGKIRAGDMVVFLKPVAVVPAVVRRDGRVQAGGHPADHARLGIIERQLDAMTGQPGVIGQVAARVIPRGKVKGSARRSMTMAAALRAVLLMGLMPAAGYGEVLAALFGDLPLLPWHVPFGVPTDTVLATWRDAAGRSPCCCCRTWCSPRRTPSTWTMITAPSPPVTCAWALSTVGDPDAGHAGEPGRVRVSRHQR